MVGPCSSVLLFPRDSPDLHDREADNVFVPIGCEDVDGCSLFESAVGDESYSNWTFLPLEQRRVEYCELDDPVPIVVVVGDQCSACLSNRLNCAASPARAAVCESAAQTASLLLPAL
jgi:hypothetical protein